MALSKDDILKADDLPKELVSVPEWGGEVWVRTMTGTERDKFERSIIKNVGKDVKANMDNIRAKLCVQTIVDNDGTLLFAPADIVTLAGKSSKALDRVFAIAQRLSGLSDDDVEGLAKNSETGLSEDSISD